MSDKLNPILLLSKKIKSIADIGLLYSKNEYDTERYTELLDISFELLHLLTGKKIELLKHLYSNAQEYPTAKVDIRGVLLLNGKILLVKESADGKWSLPGGWADIGYSPREVIIKEFKEETGLDVVPEKLLAVFDKKMHAHPPQLFYVYKFVFLCTAVSTEIKKGFDILNVDYFDINNLPELSEDRILASQLQLLYKKIVEHDTMTYCD